MFLNHNGNKLETSNRNVTTGKFQSIWRLNNIFLITFKQHTSKHMGQIKNLKRNFKTLK